jgi:hypothetical protein
MFELDAEGGRGGEDGRSSETMGTGGAEEEEEQLASVEEEGVKKKIGCSQLEK